MSDIYIALGGGGGISSDEVTATSSHVLQGQTYVGVDTNDEIGVGTMPNNPAQNVSLNCGQSVAIPLGYNPGSTITANSLASQTGGATADDSKVLSSYTYWKDGVKRTGNLAVSSVVSFNVAQYSNLTLIASWALPSRGPWSGLRVVCKQGGYPSHASDGTLFYEGSGTSATKTLSAGTWYFRAWNYITTGQGRMYGNYVDKAVTNNQVKGQQALTSSGVFTIPASVYSISIFCVGGGGSGGQYSNRFPNNGGGGGGGYTSTGTYNVTPGQQLSITIGAGGNLSSGGTTSVGRLISAAGGAAGWVSGGGDGGSGGGCGQKRNGGSDGSDGEGSNSGAHIKGIGQGRTTRAFGESNNTLYAGGGGGGFAPNGSTTNWGGLGGAGGGGNGAGATLKGGPLTAASGTSGTGGGGGGGCYNEEADDTRYYWCASYAPGGSGIVLIRWGY